jgi:antitoxin (DNA-binding transcriptional repressor) of toxin-antitoxin stability system
VERCGERIARLVALKAAKPRVPGMDKGKVLIGPDFDAPIPEFDPDNMHAEDPMRDMLK